MPAARITLWGPCGARGHAERTFDPERLLREMSDAELLDYGRPARVKAEAGSGFWARKLRSAREEWKRREWERRKSGLRQ